MTMPAGLRSHTPMSHTASKPNPPIASHSAVGTESRASASPYFRLKPANHAQVLISNMLGYRGHLDMAALLRHPLLYGAGDLLLADFLQLLVLVGGEDRTHLRVVLIVHRLELFEFLYLGERRIVLDGRNAGRFAFENGDHLHLLLRGQVQLLRHAGEFFGGRGSLRHEQQASGKCQGRNANELFHSYLHISGGCAAAPGGALVRLRSRMFLTNRSTVP